jgi:alkylation response protein AidB-like acyl-CoA dehydrogenase
MPGKDLFDLRDIHFNLFEHLRISEMTAMPAYAGASVALARDLLAACVRMVTETIAPSYEVADRAGCRHDPATSSVSTPPAFRHAVRAFMDGAWMFLDPGHEHATAGQPFPVAIAIWEVANRASFQALAVPAVTTAVARMIAASGSADLQARYSPRLCTGQWTAAMDITEAHAGSMVADIRTTARRDGDRWLLRGQKIFITGGEHDLSENIVHAVLARVEGGAPGIKGLGLFLVPKFLVGADGTMGARNDLRCTGIEEKMGMHAVPTCTMSFGDDDRCVGELVGQPGAGIQVMFKVMNDMRLFVGVQALGAATGAYQNALEHARTRVQGPLAAQARDPAAPRVPIVRHPDVARMLGTMRALTEGARALILYTAAQVGYAHFSEDAARRSEAAELVELLTPLCKGYVTTQMIRVSELAMLVHGGSGYIRGAGAELLHRDLMAAPIYEGTNGIQAIDLLARKLPARGAAGFLDLLQRIATFVDNHPGDEHVAALGRARDAVMSTAMGLFGAQQAGDLDSALLGASHFIMMAGDLVCGWRLLEGAAIARAALADHPGDAFYEAKLCTAEIFATTILPELMARATTCAAKSRAALKIRWEE